MVCGEANAYFAEVMKSAEERGLAESVQYLGLKDRREIVELINRCDLGVSRIIVTALLISILPPGSSSSFWESQSSLHAHSGSRIISGMTTFSFSKPEISRIWLDKLSLPISIGKSWSRSWSEGQRVYLANSWSRQKSVLLDSIADLL